MSWLPPPPVPSHVGEDRTWIAPSLRFSKRKLKTFTYVVVDEIVEGVVGLSLSPWPIADSKGRLRFDVNTDPVHVAVDVKIFCDFLRDRGLPFFPPKEAASDEAKRGLLIGTTFAARITGPPGVRWGKPLERRIAEIHDITPDARNLAKLAHYGALTEEWSKEKADRLGFVEEERAKEST